MMKIKKKCVNNSTILLVKKELNVGELLARIELGEIDKEKYSKITNDKRKEEFLTSRILCNQFFGDYTQIFYRENGAPYLKNGYRINISHSATHLALILSKDSKVAIDIESPSERVLRIKERAFSSDELAFLEGENLTEYIKFWCAKECMIKIQTNRGIDFRDKINLYYRDDKFYGYLVEEELEYELFSEITKSYCMVWIC